MEGTRLRLRSARWGERELAVGLVGGVPGAQRRAGRRAPRRCCPTGCGPAGSSWRAGFAAARWPGRLQVERVAGTTWVLDVAHNPAGAQALAAALDGLELPRPRVLVAGILADKDWRSDAARRWRSARRRRCSPPPPPPPRRAAGSPPPSPLAAPRAPRARAGDPATWRTRSPARRTLAPHGTVVVTGSVHTVGDAMTALGIEP